MIVKTCERHSTALREWQKTGLKNVTLIHFDAHHDSNGLSRHEKSDKLIQKDSIYLTKPGNLEISNFIAHATNLKIFNKIIWVNETFNSSNDFHQRIYREFALAGFGFNSFIWLGYNEVIKAYETIIDDIHWIFCNFEALICFRSEIFMNSIFDFDIDYLFTQTKKNIENSLNRLLSWIIRSSNLIDYLIISYSYEGGYITREVYDEVQKYVAHNFKITKLHEDKFPLYNLMTCDTYKLFQKALFFYHNKDYSSVLSLLTLKHDLPPGYYFLFGLSNYALNRIDEAVKGYEAALNLDCNCASAIINLSNIYIEQSDCKKSLKLLSNYYNQCNHLPSFHYSLAQTFFKLKSFSHANIEYKIACDQHQSNYIYRYCYAQNKLYLKRKHEAKEILLDLMTKPLSIRYKKMISQRIDF